MPLVDLVHSGVLRIDRRNGRELLRKTRLAVGLWILFSVPILSMGCGSDNFVNGDMAVDRGQVQADLGGSQDLVGKPDAGQKGFGTPCTDSVECSSRICLKSCAGYSCSKKCTPGLTNACPAGYGCIGVNGAVEPGKVDYVCVTQCDMGAVDLKGPDGSGDLKILDSMLPDKSAPDAPLPDLAKPDAAVPDLPVPDAPLLDMAASDEAVPDILVPDAPLPDVAAPDQAVPDLLVPDAPLPDVAAPDQAVPDLLVPDFALPDLAKPDVVKQWTCAGVGTTGPSMALVPKVAGGYYCIDSTEVTRSQYATFAGLTPSGQPSVCSWNTTYTPVQNTTGQCSKGEWPPGTRGDHPVVCIDWCDAHMFCAWAGKRLCTTIYNQFSNAATSEWYNACSMGGAQTYPYPGTTYGANTCNGHEHSLVDTVAVKAMSGCVGGYPGIYDMSGNVWEFTQACDGTLGAADACRSAGGAYYTTQPAMVCSLQYFGEFKRNEVQSALGFRCCADAK